MIVLSLFDGMSCGRIALERAGIEVTKYFASEVDKNAIKVSKSNWDDVIHVGDVTKVRFANGVLYTENGEYDVGDIDLLIAGSPCQGFSFAGGKLAFNDPRSSLYFEFTRLLKETKAKKFFLENVRMKEEYENVITFQLGVKPLKINSRAYSAQNRLRYYWTNIDNNLKNVHDVDGSPKLLSILEDKDCVAVYTLPRGYNKGGPGQMEKMPCITISSWQHNFFVQKYDGSLRKFTPTECERAQCVPDGYTNHVSETNRYKCLGNGWTVSVIEKFFENIKQQPNKLAA